MTHEAEKLIQQVRNSQRALQALLNYLESQTGYTEEDLRYCRDMLRRIARELVSISRGRLGELETRPTFGLI